MTPDRAAYDRTRIDWQSLTQLARSAAAHGREKPLSGKVVRVERRERTVRGFLRSRTVTEEVEVGHRLCPDYWVLESRDWHRKRHDGQQWDETQEIYRYCLGVDGSLFVRTESEEEGQWGGPFFHNVEPPTFRPFTDADVLLLDFAPLHRDDSGRGLSSYSWGHREASDQLRAPAKGAGLTAVLRARIPAAPSRNASGPGARPQKAQPPAARRAPSRTSPAPVASGSRRDRGTIRSADTSPARRAEFQKIARLLRAAAEAGDRPAPARAERVPCPASVGDPARPGHDRLRARMSDFPAGTWSKRTSAGHEFVVTLQPDGRLAERSAHDGSGESWKGEWRRTGNGIRTTIGAYVADLVEEGDELRGPERMNRVTVGSVTFSDRRPDEPSLASFVDDMLDEAAPRDLDPAVRRRLAADLVQRVTDRINRQLIEALPESAFAPFDRLLDEGADDATVQAFFAEAIPDMQGVVARTLVEFRGGYIRDRG